MERRKFLYLMSLVIVFGFLSCTENIVSKANLGFSEGKRGFNEQYLKRDLFDHFPKRISEDCLRMHSSPPSKRGVNYMGYIYLICSLDNEDGNFIDENSISYNEENENIIINQSDLKRNIFPVEKCNIWHAEKLPIPYFKSFDFGMGVEEEEKIVNGENYSNFTYTIPSDLQVYVIQAEAGDFWKESCNENRPESLKEWQHGFSRGIAVSNSEDIIVYWTMIW
jgi:hypothetical protein